MTTKTKERSFVIEVYNKDNDEWKPSSYTNGIPTHYHSKEEAELVRAEMVLSKHHKYRVSEYAENKLNKLVKKENKMKTMAKVKDNNKARLGLFAINEMGMLALFIGHIYGAARLCHFYPRSWGYLTQNELRSARDSNRDLYRLIVHDYQVGLGVKEEDVQYFLPEKPVNVPLQEDLYSSVERVRNSLKTIYEAHTEVPVEDTAEEDDLRDAFEQTIIELDNLMVDINDYRRKNS